MWLRRKSRLNGEISMKGKLKGRAFGRQGLRRRRRRGGQERKRRIIKVEDLT